MLCYLYRAVDNPELEKAVQIELKNIKPIVPGSLHTTFVTEGLIDCVKHIQICEIENNQDDNIQHIVVWILIDEFQNIVKTVIF